MIALISDIHANLEALDAVLADMAAYPVDRVFCLGDVIGYGPDPREALRRVRRCEFTLLGNHEEGLLYSAEGFNERARRALAWTRAELSDSRYPKEENYAFWEQIDGFETTRTEGDHHFVHGSPRDPVREYVMPADALDRAKMGAIFAQLPVRHSFGGHTHVPGIFPEGGAFRHQSEFPDWVPLPRVRSLVNIGSVGQPRDGDPRASYLLLDGDRILFRRVAYDVEATMRKIFGNPELDDYLGRRLKVGQ
jgi:diadenosine tetraphosphatase ApaH/serine/threonine PP2A family protein phosphatase